MVVENLIEALQANTLRLFLLIVANLRSTPDTLDQKGLFFSFFIHDFTIRA
jgi:hypothetical protein